MAVNPITKLEGLLAKAPLADRTELACVLLIDIGCLLEERRWSLSDISERLILNGGVSINIDLDNYEEVTLCVFPWLPLSTNKAATNKLVSALRFQFEAHIYPASKIRVKEEYGNHWILMCLNCNSIDVATYKVERTPTLGTVAKDVDKVLTELNGEPITEHIEHCAVCAGCHEMYSSFGGDHTMHFDTLFNTISVEDAQKLAVYIGKPNNSVTEF